MEYVGEEIIIFGIDMRGACILALVWVLTGCGVGSGIYGFDEPQIEPVENGQIGLGLNFNYELSKQIEVTIGITDPRLTFNDSYIGRSQNTNDTGYWMIPVTNTSSEDLCLIQLDGGNAYDVNGDLLSELERDRYSLYGSVRRHVPTGEYLQSCLAAGEQGFFLGSLDGYAGINRLDFSAVSISSDSFTALNSKVEHDGNYRVSFTNTTLSSDQTISINLVNTGTVSAVLNSYVDYIFDLYSSYSRVFILFDENDRPLIWKIIHNINGRAIDVVMPPGGSFELSTTDSYSGDIDFYGLASKVKFFLLYSDGE